MIWWDSVLSSPEYFLSYEFLPEKGQYSFSHLRFLSIFRVRRVFFLTDKSNLAKSLLKCHNLGCTHQRIRQESPAPWTTWGAISSCKIQRKAKLEFFLPKGSLSFRAKGKTCYKWGKIHETQDPVNSKAPWKMLIHSSGLVNFTINQSLESFPCNIQQRSGI